MNPIALPASSERQALELGLAKLNSFAAEFGVDEYGYEYKNWVPTWIPFIQASTNIYPRDNSGVTPAFVVVPAGGKKIFPVFTPQDHPFLLLDVKIASSPYTSEGPGIQPSRFDDPYDLGSIPVDQKTLWRKWILPRDEEVSASLIATSPAGKEIFGGTINATQFGAGIASGTIAPHYEPLHLSLLQNGWSGPGALRYPILFPKQGIIKVQVNVAAGTNNRAVNGVCRGYRIMR